MTVRFSLGLTTVGFSVALLSGCTSGINITDGEYIALESACAAVQREAVDAAHATTTFGHLPIVVTGSRCREMVDFARQAGCDFITTGQWIDSQLWRSGRWAITVERVCT